MVNTCRRPFFADSARLPKSFVPPEGGRGVFPGCAPCICYSGSGPDALAAPPGGRGGNFLGNTCRHPFFANSVLVAKVECAPGGGVFFLAAPPHPLLPIRPDALTGAALGGGRGVFLVNTCWRPFFADSALVTQVVCTSGEGGGIPFPPESKIRPRRADFSVVMMA